MDAIGKHSTFQKLPSSDRLPRGHAPYTTSLAIADFHQSLLSSRLLKKKSTQSADSSLFLRKVDEKHSNFSLRGFKPGYSYSEYAASQCSNEKVPFQVSSAYNELSTFSENDLTTVDRNIEIKGFRNTTSQVLHKDADLLEHNHLKRSFFSEGLFDGNNVCRHCCLTTTNTALLGTFSHSPDDSRSQNFSCKPPASQLLELKESLTWSNSISEECSKIKQSKVGQLHKHGNEAASLDCSCAVSRISSQSRYATVSGHQPLEISVPETSFPTTRKNKSSIGNALKKAPAKDLITDITETNSDLIRDAGKPQSLYSDGENFLHHHATAKSQSESEIPLPLAANEHITSPPSDSFFLSAPTFSTTASSDTLIDKLEQYKSKSRKFRLLNQRGSRLKTEQMTNGAAIPIDETCLNTQCKHDKYNNSNGLEVRWPGTTCRPEILPLLHRQVGDQGLVHLTEASMRVQSSDSRPLAVENGSTCFNASGVLECSTAQGRSFTEAVSVSTYQNIDSRTTPFSNVNATGLSLYDAFQTRPFNLKATETPGTSRPRKNVKGSVNSPNGVLEVVLGDLKGLETLDIEGMRDFYAEVRVVRAAPAPLDPDFCLSTQTICNEYVILSQRITHRLGQCMETSVGDLACTQSNARDVSGVCQPCRLWSKHVHRECEPFIRRSRTLKALAGTVEPSKAHVIEFDLNGIETADLFLVVCIMETPTWSGLRFDPLISCPVETLPTGKRLNDALQLPHSMHLSPIPNLVSDELLYSARSYAAASWQTDASDVAHTGEQQRHLLGPKALQNVLLDVDFNFIRCVSSPVMTKATTGDRRRLRTRSHVLKPNIIGRSFVRMIDVGVDTSDLGQESPQGKSKAPDTSGYYTGPGLHHFHCVKCGETDNVRGSCHQWRPLPILSDCQICVQLRQRKSDAKKSHESPNILSPSHGVSPTFDLPLRSPKGQKSERCASKNYLRKALIKVVHDTQLTSASQRPILSSGIIKKACRKDKPASEHNCGMIVIPEANTCDGFSTSAKALSKNVQNLVANSMVESKLHLTSQPIVSMLTPCDQRSFRSHGTVLAKEEVAACTGHPVLSELPTINVSRDSSVACHKACHKNSDMMTQRISLIEKANVGSYGSTEVNLNGKTTQHEKVELRASKLHTKDIAHIIKLYINQVKVPGNFENKFRYLFEPESHSYAVEIFLSASSDDDIDHLDKRSVRRTMMVKVNSSQILKWQELLSIPVLKTNLREFGILNAGDVYLGIAIINDTGQYIDLPKIFLSADYTLIKLQEVVSLYGVGLSWRESDEILLGEAAISMKIGIEPGR